MDLVIKASLFASRHFVFAMNSMSQFIREAIPSSILIFHSQKQTSKLRKTCWMRLPHPTTKFSHVALFAICRVRNDRMP